MKKSSYLKTRIFWTTIPTLIFAILTITSAKIISFHSVHSEYKELLEDRSFAIAKNIRTVVNQNLSVFCLSSLYWMNDYIYGIVMNNDDISYGFIADDHHMILFHNDERLANSQLDAGNYTQLSQVDDFARLTISVGPFYELILPIVKSDKVIGCIHLGIPKKLIDSKISGMIILPAIVLIVSLIISSATAAFIAGYVASKVTAIKKGLARIQQDLGFRLAPMKGEFGEVVEAINDMAHSLEQQKKIALQIERADRLAAIGEVSAGLAHEIRNPLSAIKGFIQLIEEGLDKDDYKLTYTRIVNQEVDRLYKMIGTLLYYAQPSAPEMSFVSINHVIDDTLLLINIELSKKAHEINKHYNHNLPKIPVDSEQVKQVFLNLILNSTQAMDGTGQITIKTDLGDHDDFIKISIDDTGKGIEEKNIKRIFDPFFTTREEGTGLGLAVVQKIVELNGGYINVASQLGQGTTFNIFLPSE
ncbi:MAG: hypothetical protein GY874_18350 [Desulfobacteraceae bacterium]|nr:hypothetical protein [Desulfobacteraceae bacterium]